MQFVEHAVVEGVHYHSIHSDLNELNLLAFKFIFSIKIYLPYDDRIHGILPYLDHHQINLYHKLNKRVEIESNSSVFQQS